MGEASGTSGPICLTDPKGAVRSVVIVAAEHIYGSLKPVRITIDGMC